MTSNNRPVLSKFHNANTTSHADSGSATLVDTPVANLTINVDLSMGNVQHFSLPENAGATTYNIESSNMGRISNGKRFTFIIKQNSTSTDTLTWDPEFHFTDGAPPSFPAGAGSTDVVTAIHWVGVMYCSFVENVHTSV